MMLSKQRRRMKRDPIMVREVCETCPHCEDIDGREHCTFLIATKLEVYEYDEAIYKHRITENCPRQHHHRIRNKLELI